MKTGMMMDLRARPGGTAILVVVSFLLPMLLAILPPLQATAAFALERDLQSGLCQPLESGKHPPGHAAHDACCTLCQAGAPLTAALRELPMVAPRGEAVEPSPVVERQARAGPGAELELVLPRGPPTLS